MEIPADTTKVASRFAPYVQELHEFFASHGMHFGEVEDLREFSRKLEAPGPFSSELSSMVRSVIFRERGTVPRSDLLALVAVSIAGPSVGKVAGGASAPVSQLTDFIAGVIRAPRNEPGPVTTPEFAAGDETSLDASPAAAVTIVAPSSGRDKQVRPVRQAGLGRLDAVEPASPITAKEGHAGNDGGGREAESQAGDAYLTSDLQEALKRMETTSLEFRLYLDSIEERVRRIEPRDGPASELAAEPVREDLAAAKLRAGEEISPPANHQTVPAVKRPFIVETPAAQTLPAEAPGEHPAKGALLHNVPFLSADASEPFAHGNEEPALEDRWVRMRSAHAKRIYAGVGGFLMLLIAFLVWQSPDGHQVVPPPGNVDNGVFNTSTRASSAPKPTPYGQNASIAEHAYGSAAASGRQPVSRTQAATLAGAATARDVYSSPPAEASASSTTQGAATGSAYTAPPQAAVPDSNASLSDQVETQRVDKRAGSRSYSAGKMTQQRSLAVSSGVMAGNLVFAPPPTYPKLASFTHVQGQVLLQAIVSRSGKVANLKVVRGPRLLRGAAMSAVYKWRYRPYLVSGHAVDVATIVSVDFVLHH